MKRAIVAAAALIGIVGTAATIVPASAQTGYTIYHIKYYSDAYSLYKFTTVSTFEGRCRAC